MINVISFVKKSAPKDINKLNSQNQGNSNNKNKNKNKNNKRAEEGTNSY